MALLFLEVRTYSLSSTLRSTNPTHHVMASLQRSSSPTFPERAESQFGDRSSQRPTKSRRIRLACLRCQKRKIKCDGNFPKCSACQKASVECVDGKRTSDDGNISRSEAEHLRGHIQRLETSLRSIDPNVNIENLGNDEHTHPACRQERAAPSLGPVSSENDPRYTTDATTNASRGSPEVEPSFDNEIIQTPPQRLGELPSRSEIAHDIGLVPVSGGIGKYVGPSSGLAITKLIFNRASRGDRRSGALRGNTSTTAESPSTITSRTLLTIEPSGLPTLLTQATQLSRIYFEYVHIQYPFLHEPTYFHLLQSVYADPDLSPSWTKFQVTMVLAISASILAKRLPIPYSGESFCAAALRITEEIDFQGSIQGLQCLLLIYVFTLHSSFSGISPWHLNYQCLASVIDLGLQRDMPVSNLLNHFEREMRTRIFWVVYSIDRAIATTLGRPIGLRDEGCDLRLPEGTEDCHLQNPKLSDRGSVTTQTTISFGSIACATTLFGLAQLNSEIKYILHSVSRHTPRYTYPQIPDIDLWQEDVWRRLHDCIEQGPKFLDERRYLSAMCEIRYNEIVMHLFRPTPRIRSPKKVNLWRCYASAEKTISLWKEVYEADRMSYSWVTIHSVCLSALTILYCIWTAADIATSTSIPTLISTTRNASILLSAAGEHWIEARRSRSRLDSLCDATVRWLTDRVHKSSNLRDERPYTRREQNGSQPITPTNDMQHRGRCPPSGVGNGAKDLQPSTIPEPNQSTQTADSEQQPSFTEFAPPEGIFSQYINNEDLATFLGAPDAFSSDKNWLMEGIFTDYQPLFEFSGADFGMTFDI